jgi:Tol biopolymer transport system component
METTLEKQPDLTPGYVTSSVPPDAALVNRHLEKIITSPEFVRSERMVSFLRFVVTASLEGRQGLLSERLIGREVFAKPTTWDPTVDTIVRSEARRLRSKLQLYYESYGRTDELRIHIPKGGYVPEFEWKPVAPAVSVPSAEAGSAPGTANTRWLGLAVAFLLALPLLGVALWHRHRSQASSLFVNEPFSILPFTSEMGREFSPAISPDGRTVAYVWTNDDGGPDIYLRPVENGSPHALNAMPAVRLFPAWSPDGTRIAFLQVHGDEVDLNVDRLRDGSEISVTHVAKQIGQWADDNSPLLGAPGPVWTKDGKGLILADYDPARDSGGIFLFDLMGRRTPLTSTSGEDHDLYPRLSPDGTKLAYARYSSHGVADLFVQPMEPLAKPRRLTSDRRAIQGLTWTPDSRRILFSSSRTGSFQLWSVLAEGGEVRIAPTNSSSAAEPAMAPSGDWLLYVESHANWNIWRRPLDGSARPPQRLLSSSGRNYDPRYSPDGRWIAFVSDRSGSMELWVADSEGRGARQLTHLNVPWLGGISWSPGGDRIAFDARPQDHSAIFLIPFAGGEPQLLEHNAYEERMPSWSADGRSLYFNSNRDGSLAAWRRSLVNGSVQRIAQAGIFAVAPTGQGLIYSSRNGELWSSDLDGNHPAELMGGLRADPVMSWLPVGRSLYLSRFDARTHVYSFLRYRDGQTVSVGVSEGPLVPNAPDIAVSPDERWLLYAGEDSSQSDLKIRKAR